MALKRKTPKALEILMKIYAIIYNSVLPYNIMSIVLFSLQVEYVLERLRKMKPAEDVTSPPQPEGTTL